VGGKGAVVSPEIETLRRLPTRGRRQRGKGAVVSPEIETRIEDLQKLTEVQVARERWSRLRLKPINVN